MFSNSHGNPRVDDRRLLCGIILINRNGLRWCDTHTNIGAVLGVAATEACQWCGLACRGRLGDRIKLMFCDRPDDDAVFQAKKKFAQQIAVSRRMGHHVSKSINADDRGYRILM